MNSPYQNPHDYWRWFDVVFKRREISQCSSFRIYKSWSLVFAFNFSNYYYYYYYYYFKIEKKHCFFFFLSNFKFVEKWEHWGLSGGQRPGCASNPLLKMMENYWYYIIMTLDFIRYKIVISEKKLCLILLSIISN